MNVGEKIKLFRNLKKLSQKALSELSGVSEIAIRKYEAGDRSPKPEQLKKIAHALEIGENILFDIPLSSLSIDTVGDVMALLLLLENKIGATYVAPTNNKGEINCSKLSIHFENAKVNELLARWISECTIAENGKAFSVRNKATFSEEECERAEQLSTAILEQTKQSITSDTTPLSNKTDK